MLKLRDLAVRPDFQVGELHVSPSRRIVQGPAGSVHLQPLVMNAFLQLLDADGEVVTRDQLFEQCWGDNLVGNESLNRVMARVRRIPAEVGPELLEIETIPRTGYRVSGDILKLLKTGPEALHRAPAATSRFSRRTIIVSASAAGAMGVAALRWASGARTARRFDDLVGEARLSVRNFDFDESTARGLEEAVAIRPDSAAAWGLLGLVESMRAQESETSPDHARKIAAADNAVGRALAIDPREPNALLARFELQGSTLDWIARDRRLREIVGIDPANVIAIAELVALLQAAGFNRESWNWNERALLIVPLSAELLGLRALKLWIAGRLGEADKVIDQVRALYPSDRGAWWVQFLILSLTDRAEGAVAMLRSEPKMLGAPLAGLWQDCLPALIERSSANLIKARRACMTAATQAGELAAHAVMILATFGEIDDAFDVADGFLLWRGHTVRQGRPTTQDATDAAWRVGVQWLFTPPCASMRADARFIPLCDGIGLADYWRSRGRKPDYLVPL